MNYFDHAGTESYYGIHVSVIGEQGEVYYVIAVAVKGDSLDAYHHAVENHLFRQEEDVDHIDFIEELTKEEYEELKRNNEGGKKNDEA